MYLVLVGLVVLVLWVWFAGLSLVRLFGWRRRALQGLGLDAFPAGWLLILFLTTGFVVTGIMAAWLALDGLLTPGQRTNRQRATGRKDPPSLRR